MHMYLFKFTTSEFGFNKFGGKDPTEEKDKGIKDLRREGEEASRKSREGEG